MEKRTYLIKEKMNMARQGRPVTLGFIGGSITQGTGASAYDKCYMSRVSEWWGSRFPQARHTYINAGIGGTDSKFGVARVEDDLLKYKPDFVIIEFAVNDVDNPDCLETAEGLITKILAYNNRTAILILCNIIYDSRASRQDEYEKLAAHYEIPLIGVRDSIVRDIDQGLFSKEEISPDNIHPSDLGHKLIAGLITSYLHKLMQEDDLGEQADNVSDSEVTSSYQISKQAITANRYETAYRIDNRQVTPYLAGFKKDIRSQSDIRDCFKNGWTGIKAGDLISFNLEFKGLTVEYRRTVKGPAPKVAVRIDGEELAILDGKFDQDWGDKLELATLAEYDFTQKHKLEFEVIETGSIEFYLLALICY